MCVDVNRAPVFQALSSLEENFISDMTSWTAELSLCSSIHPASFLFFSSPCLFPSLSFKAGYKLRGSLASSFISRQGNAPSLFSHPPYPEPHPSHLTSPPLPSTPTHSSFPVPQDPVLLWCTVCCWCLGFLFFFSCPDDFSLFPSHIPPAWYDPCDLYLCMMSFPPCQCIWNCALNMTCPYVLWDLLWKSALFNTSMKGEGMENWEDCF